MLKILKIFSKITPKYSKFEKLIPTFFELLYKSHSHLTICLIVILRSVFKVYFQTMILEIVFSLKNVFEKN